VSTDKPFDQGFIPNFIDLYFELGQLVQRCLKQPVTRDEYMRVLNAIIITEGKHRTGVMKHPKDFRLAGTSGLSDLKNRSENLAERGWVVMILQGNICFLTQKSSKTYTAQLNLQPSSFKGASKNYSFQARQGTSKKFERGIWLICK